MKTQTLFTIITILLVTLSKLTAEEIPLLNKTAFAKLTEEQKLALVNKIIIAYNKTFAKYLKQKEIIQEKEEKIEKLEKKIKSNIILLKLGYGVNFSLQQNILIDFAYFKAFNLSLPLNLGLGGGIVSTINITEIQNTTFILTFGIIFLF